MRSLLQDLRYGIAVMTRRAGATTTVLVSLALAIGLNAGFFSFLNAFLNRPLHLREPDRLVAIATRWDTQTENSHSSYPDYRDLAERHPLFEGVAANFYVAAGVKTDAGPQIVLAQLASASYFDVMGIPPMLGRGFRPDEDVLPEGKRVAVISHRFWTRSFGRRPDVVGQPLLVNSEPFTVVGVAAEGFVGPRPLFATDIWVPLSLTRRILPFPISLEDRASTWLLVTARLKTGATLPQAQEAANSLAQGLARQDPGAERQKQFRLFPISTMRTGLKDPVPPETRFVSLLVMALAGVVLLVACLNVASIQLAQTSDRRGELALRLSLGASRWRLARQFVTEALLMAIPGGVLGLLLVVWTAEPLLQRQLAIVELPLTLEIPFDWRVFAYTAALALVSAVAAGLLPAIWAARRIPAGVLRGSASSARTGSRSRLSQGLVVAQVALSAVLLVTAGLAIQSVRHAGRIDPGFDLTRTLLLPVDLGFGQYDEVTGRRFFSEAREAVSRLPGVRGAAFALDLPLGQMHVRTYVTIDGYTPSRNEDMALRYNAVSTGYFDTMQVAIARGRPIDARDGVDAPPVAVVSEAFAARYFGGDDPIGRRIQTNGRSWSIVGVMRDGRYDRLDEPVQPYFCLPVSQFGYVPRLTLLVDSRRADPAALGPDVIRELRRLDPNLPIGRMLTGLEFLRQPLQTTGGPGAFVWAPALLALGLALVGVYGLVAYSVSQRTPEFGVRMALGAQPSEVAAMVLRQGTMLMLIGSGIGLMAALGVARLLAGMFYQVRPFEPVVFATVLPLLLVGGVLACHGPVRRAVRLDPVRALRCE